MKVLGEGRGRRRVWKEEGGSERELWFLGFVRKEEGRRKVEFREEGRRLGFGREVLQE